MAMSVKAIEKEISYIPTGPVAYGRKYKKAIFEAILDHLDHKYYEEDKPLLSDDIYDAFYDTYATRWPKSPRLKATGKSTKQDDVLLPVPMPSLDKLKPGMKDLSRFFTVFIGEKVLSDKLDGISLSIVYDKGKPIEAYKRGSGTYGKVASHHIKHMNIPKRISHKKRIIVRAEAIISNPEFNTKYFKEAEEGDYTTARNFAGGILNRLKPEPLVKALDILVFEILEGRGSDQKLSVQLKYADKLGFTVVKHVTKKTLSIANLDKYYDKRLGKSEYELDGVVVTENITYERGKSKPKHAKAFKKNNLADMVDVVITKIVWEESRQGDWRPVAHYNPIQICGITNDRATAHNAYYVQKGHANKDKKKFVGKKAKPLGPGSKIRICRSGKVIPFIDHVYKGSTSGKPQMPDIEYKIKGVHAVSVKKGKTQKIKRITHFFTTIGVDGVQDTTTVKLYDAGYTSIKKVLGVSLTQYMEIEGLGRSKGMVFVKQCKEKTTGRDFATIAKASNLFKSLSDVRLERIQDTYPCLLDLFKDYDEAKVIKEIQKIKGFKDLAVDFAKALPKFRKFLKTTGLKVTVTAKVEAKGDAMSGMLVTFTGGKNKDVIAWIAEQGGKVQSKKNDTNLIVVPDYDYTSSKVDWANNNDVPVLSLEDFISKYKVSV